MSRKDPRPKSESVALPERVEILSPPYLMGRQGYVLGKECRAETGKVRHAWTGRWLVQIDDLGEVWVVSLEAREFRVLDRDGHNSIPI